MKLGFLQIGHFKYIVVVVIVNDTILSFCDQPLQLDRVSRTEKLQKALLEYLAHSTDNDPSLVVSVLLTNSKKNL